MEQRKYRWMKYNGEWRIAVEYSIHAGLATYDILASDDCIYGQHEFDKAGPYIDPPIEPIIEGEIFSTRRPWNDLLRIHWTDLSRRWPVGTGYLFGVVYGKGFTPGLENSILMSRSFWKGGTAEIEWL